MKRNSLIVIIKYLRQKKKFERDETWQSDVQNEIVKIMSEKIRGK